MIGRKAKLVTGIAFFLLACLATQTTAQSVVYSFGINPGDKFTYEVISVDSGYIHIFGNWYDGNPFVAGDQVKIEALSDISTADGTYSDVYNTFGMNTAKDLYKYTYPNGTSVNIPDFTYLFPLEAKLANGTTLTLTEMLTLRTFGHGNATANNGIVTQTTDFITYDVLEYNQTTGVMLKATYLDPFGKQAVIQLVDAYYAPLNSTNSLKLALNPSLFFISLLLIVVLKRKR